MGKHHGIHIVSDKAWIALTVIEHVITRSHIILLFYNYHSST